MNNCPCGLVVKTRVQLPPEVNGLSPLALKIGDKTEDKGTAEKINHICEIVEEVFYYYTIPVEEMVMQRAKK